MGGVHVALEFTFRSIHLASSEDSSQTDKSKGLAKLLLSEREAATTLANCADLESCWKGQPIFTGARMKQTSISGCFGMGNSREAEDQVE